jgi:hypothetical protein
VVSNTLQPLCPPEKDTLPIQQEAGWASGTVCMGPENPDVVEFDPRNVQPVAGRYTVGAMPAHEGIVHQDIIRTSLLIS